MTKMMSQRETTRVVGYPASGKGSNFLDA
jgi:hypothetical protein